MRVLGIDPGTRIAGYGIIETSGTAGRTGKLSAVAAGVWRLPAESELPVRLAQLAREFERAVEVYKPQIVCIELAFVAVNVRSAMFLGHARGVLMERAHTLGIPVVEVSATAVKLAVMGHGRGDKKLVAQALSSLLKISFEKLPLDASDALGIAYAYAIDPERAVRKKQKSSKNWSHYFSKISAALWLVGLFGLLSVSLNACNLNFKQNKVPQETPTPEAVVLSQTTGGLKDSETQKKSAPLPGQINTLR
jgi:crossover junction endodeoxyribonuclease RuvC